jgi:hypothetical protein
MTAMDVQVRQQAIEDRNRYTLVVPVYPLVPRCEPIARDRIPCRINNRDRRTDEESPESSSVNLVVQEQGARKRACGNILK